MTQLKKMKVKDFFFNFQMEGDNQRMILYLREIEEVAEEILSDKQEIVDLDRKRHGNREALSALTKEANAHWKGEDCKTWITLSNCFIQLPNKTAKDLLRKGMY